jgi:hypothetical protein
MNWRRDITSDDKLRICPISPTPEGFVSSKNIRLPFSSTFLNYFLILCRKFDENATEKNVSGTNQIIGLAFSNQKIKKNIEILHQKICRGQIWSFDTWMKSLFQREFCAFFFFYLQFDWFWLIQFLNLHENVNVCLHNFLSKCICTQFATAHHCKKWQLIKCRPRKHTQYIHRHRGYYSIRISSIYFLW